MSEVMDHLLAPDVVQMVFQPIVEIAHGQRRLWAVEALARGPAGTHFEQASVLFDYVRLKREETRMDRRCAAEAIARVSAFTDSVPRLTVNIHASTLERDRGFATFLESAIVAADFDPTRVIVEIVEQGHYFAAVRLGAALAELRALGVRIAVDDLGLGNGNFRTVLDVRPEYLKIDRYFVHGCASDANRRSLLRSAMQIASDFGAVVIAEGIENESDLSVLTDLGITLVQGFLLGRPEPVPVLNRISMAAPLVPAGDNSLRSLA